MPRVVLLGLIWLVRSRYSPDCTLSNKHCECLLNSAGFRCLSVYLRSMSLDRNPVILSNFSRRRLDASSAKEPMNDFKDLLDQAERKAAEKQKLVELQREDVHGGINGTFNKIFEQLIEIRRFCRNDIEQQALNVQVRRLSIP